MWRWYITLFAGCEQNSVQGGCPIYNSSLYQFCTGKKTHKILLNVGAFYDNLLKTHPIYVNWAPSPAMKPLDRYTKICEKALQKAGTYTYTMLMWEPPPGVFTHTTRYGKRKQLLATNVRHAYPPLSQSRWLFTPTMSWTQVLHASTRVVFFFLSPPPLVFVKDLILTKNTSVSAECVRDPSKNECEARAP